MISIQDECGQVRVISIDGSVGCKRTVVSFRRDECSDYLRRERLYRYCAMTGSDVGWGTLCTTGWE